MIEALDKLLNEIIFLILSFALAVVVIVQLGYFGVGTDVAAWLGWLQLLLIGAGFYLVTVYVRSSAWAGRN